MDFSFNKDKVEKECYKLIGISNLGNSSLMGYMKNPKYDKKRKDGEFTLTELTFIHQIVKSLATNRTETKELLDFIFKSKGYRHQKDSLFLSSVYIIPYEKNERHCSMADFFGFCKDDLNCVQEFCQFIKNLHIEDHESVVGVVYHGRCLKTNGYRRVTMISETVSPIDAAVGSWLLRESDVPYYLSSNNLSRDAVCSFVMEIIHNSWYTEEILALIPHATLRIIREVAEIF